MNPNLGAPDRERRSPRVRVEARDGDDRLRVTFHETSVDVRIPVSPAGEAAGPCPDCAGALVTRSGTLACTDCDREHALPAGATVLDTACECGLARVEVTRGVTVEVCADRACEPLDAAIEAELDRRFDCPDCGRDLRVREHRGRAFLGCDGYPDCETAFSVPAGTFAGECACGLPRFETATGVRCLDGTCERKRGTETAGGDGT